MKTNSRTSALEKKHRKKQISEHAILFCSFEKGLQQTKSSTHKIEFLKNISYLNNLGFRELKKTVHEHN